MACNFELRSSMDSRMHQFFNSLSLLLIRIIYFEYFEQNIKKVDSSSHTFEQESFIKFLFRIKQSFEFRMKT